MRKTVVAVLLALAGSVLTGCLREDFKESEPVLKADVECLEVDALPQDETESVTGVIKITSNRSWNAAFVNETGTVEVPEWVRMETASHANLSDASDTKAFHLFFDANRVNRSRSTRLQLISGERELIVGVVQRALVYALSVTGETHLTVGYAASEQQIGIRCNTAWTACVKDGATAAVALSATEGYGDATLTVDIAENTDLNAGKSAVIILSAEECDDIEIAIAQQRAEPYLILDRENTPVVLSGGATSSRILFRTNSEWSATVVESTFPELTIDPQSGDGTADGIDLRFPSNVSDGEVSATIEFQIAGTTIAERITVTQKRGYLITLDFTEGDPFSEQTLPTTSASAVQTATCYTLSQNGTDYPIEITPAAEKGFYLGGTSEKYLIFTGSGTIRIPKLDRFALSSVKITAISASNRRYSIAANSDGSNTVRGGEEFQFAAGEHTWTLTGTVPDTHYYFYCATANPRIQRLEFIYE